MSSTTSIFDDEVRGNVKFSPVSGVLFTEWSGGGAGPGSGGRQVQGLGSGGGRACPR